LKGYSGNYDFYRKTREEENQYACDNSETRSRK